ncbi:MAG: YcgN family cysteine cluster protein [Alphaproteobacteria bacterium]|nr:YcgN family cysteine cluster protein [Alphaproteobacteria bacterium]
MKTNKPFWETKTLLEMTDDEWEALCDGCGKCCLEKVIFEEDNTLAFTNIACRLLDRRTCRCRHYADRSRYVPECQRIRPETIHQCYWLPKTCAYRLLDEGKPLPEWHPLISGTPMSVHKAKMSAAGRCVAPKPEEDFQDYIVEWDDL